MEYFGGWGVSHKCDCAKTFGLGLVPAKSLFTANVNAPGKDGV